MTKEELIAECLAQPEDVRAEIAMTLMESAPEYGAARPGLDPEWREEILRRMAAFRSGEDPGVTAEEFFGRSDWQLHP